MSLNNRISFKHNIALSGKTALSILLLLLAGRLLYAKQTKTTAIDSLQKQLEDLEGKTDFLSSKNRAVTYINLFHKYRVSNTDTAGSIALKAFAEIKLFEDRFHNAANSANHLYTRFYNAMVGYKRTINEPDSALFYLRKGFYYLTLAPDPGILGDMYTLVGNLYYDDGNSEKALAYFFKALKVFEKAKIIPGIATSECNIGVEYINLQKIKEAKYHLNIAIKYGEKTDEYAALIDAYNNQGAAYDESGDMDSAIYFYSKALNLCKTQHYMVKASSMYNNIGLVYLEKNMLDSAELYFKNSAILKRKNKRSRSMAYLYNNIGLLYKNKHQYQLSKKYIDSAFVIARELGMIEIFSEGMLNLSEIYYEEKDYKKSREALADYITYRDSIYNDDKVSDITRMQSQYEFGLKEQKSKLEQEKKDLLTAQEHNKDVLTRNFLLIGLTLSCLLGYIAFRNYRKKEKANSLLISKNEEIEHQKEIIEEKSKELSDSINYAKHIQLSVLPEIKLEDLFSDSFVLYQPRDVVSGDFYWLEKKGDLHFIAVGDCTGHGVPGAFMTMIGSILLNEIFHEKKIFEPGKILSELNRLVKLSLKQLNENSDSKDGMDICFCIINTATNTLTYSGANRPLWIYRESGNEIALHDYSPNKMAIGGYTPFEYTYEQHVINLQNNDCIYMFTDGYGDQFGGVQNKKLSTKKMKELMKNHHRENMLSQKNCFGMYYSNWKNECEQVDDVLLLGIKIQSNQS